MILARTGLLALASGTAQLAIGASVVGVEGQGELQGNLVSTGQVCVSNLRVGQLKGRAVLDVEGDFGFGELGLAPVPSSQRMLLALQRGAVPVLEDLAQAFVVLLLESIELDDARVALQDSDLVAPGGAAPLGASNVAVIEGEGVTAAGGFPAKAGLCESALAALLGEVKVDAVEALTVDETAISMLEHLKFWVMREFGGREETERNTRAASASLGRAKTRWGAAVKSKVEQREEAREAANTHIAVILAAQSDANNKCRRDGFQNLSCVWR